MIRPGLDHRNFKNLIYQGTVPMRTRTNEGGPTMHRNLLQLKKYPDSFSKLKELAGDEFFIVNPNRELIENMMKAWDQRPPFVVDVPFLDVALQFFDFHYSDIFKESVSLDDMVYDMIDMTKSPGYPGSLFTIRSKRSAYADRAFIHHKDEMKRDGFPRVAFHKVTPKVEFLPKSNIEMGKCRLFVIPELLLLESQIKFGKLISLRLREYKWSSYGFNPYNGGCNRLAQRLLSKRVRFFYDVSGWDKFLGLLSRVYDSVRRFNGYCRWNKEEQKEFDWMVENTINMFCVFYDGSVYEKRYGNGSGSGTTTRDNILAHVIIVATILIAAYYDKYGKHPHFSFLQSQVINLFGDDNISSVDEEFDSVLKENFVADIFASFGMKLKFFFGGLDYPLSSMEFLGFKFFETKMGYIPLYDEKRLATSMVYRGVNSNTREAVLSKTFVLMMMSYPCEHHCYFREYSKQLARSIEDYGLSETERVMIDLILSTTDEVFLSTFLGLESSNSRVLEFFSRGMEEEGIKDIFFRDDQSYQCW